MHPESGAETVGSSHSTSNERPAPVTRSTLLLAAAAAAGVLAAPASALASGSVVAGPFKAKGYTMNITATDGASDSLTVLATKKKGATQQMHMWTLENPNISVNGSKATLKGSFGAFGSMNATINATRTSKGKVPAGCKGSAGTVRSGTMGGKTRLVLDSTYFKTVKPKSIPGQIVKAGKLDCSGAGAGDGTGGGSTGGTMLSSTVSDAAGQLMVSISKVGSKVSQSVMQMPADTPGAKVMHMISGTTGADGLTASDDLSSATAKAAGGFLSGTLSFSGEPMGTMSMGTVSGDFAAAFDSIGTQRLPAGNDGMLMRR